MSNDYTILAPYPASSRVIVLPQPEWGDTEAKTGIATFNRAMDGTCYSTTRNQTTKTFGWFFDLPRLKALEYLSFYSEHHSSLWQIIRPTDTLIGYVKVNPATLEMLRRGVHANSLEVVSLQMEFETI